MRSQSGGRGDIDDRSAAAVADRRRAMLHAEHGTSQVDGDGTVPRLDGCVDDALAGDRPGIVDQDVELAETRQCRRDDFPPGCLFSDVLAQEHGFAALAGEPLRQALAGSGINIGENHRGLFAQEQFRLRRALPTRGAGDQRHLSRQPCHFLTSGLCIRRLLRRVAPRNDGGCHCERSEAISHWHLCPHWETITMATMLPYTGKEFLDSLNDGREVWIYGERIKNIAEHPAFRNTARMVARLYDALHRDHAEKKNLLTCPTEWGGFTHPYFIAPRSAARPTTRQRSWRPWAPMPTFTTPTRKMPGAGIATARSGSRSSTTRSSTRRSTATWHRARRVGRPTSMRM